MSYHFTYCRAISRHHESWKPVSLLLLLIACVWWVLPGKWNKVHRKWCFWCSWKQKLWFLVTQWADRYSTTCSTAWAKYWLKHWGMNCFMGRFLCVAGNQECCAEKSLGFISHFGSRNQLKKGGAAEEETKTLHTWEKGKQGGENRAGRVTILRIICIILKELANICSTALLHWWNDASNTGRVLMDWFGKMDLSSYLDSGLSGAPHSSG